MRLPNSAHTSRPWRNPRAHARLPARGRLGLPTPGGPDDLPRLVQQFASGDGDDLNAHGRYVGDGSHGLTSRASRALFALRWQLGERLGWDTPEAGLGHRVTTLRDRLPADLRDAPRGPDLRAAPFTSVYMTETEWAAELANQTVHAVMHIGWVPGEAGGFRGQMAVLAKWNGRFGTAYKAAIVPFRRLIVYPTLIPSIGREWRAGADA